jgi:hypothetical protein
LTGASAPLLPFKYEDALPLRQNKTRGLGVYRWTSIYAHFFRKI